MENNGFIYGLEKNKNIKKANKNNYSSITSSFAALTPLISYLAIKYHNNFTSFNVHPRSSRETFKGIKDRKLACIQIGYLIKLFKQKIYYSGFKIAGTRVQIKLINFVDDNYF